MSRSRAEWEASADGLTICDQAFIAGTFTPAADEKTFPSVDPATGAVLADVAACDERDVDRAVAAARKAFDAGGWRADPALRRRVLLRLTELIEQHADQLAVLDSRDMGKLVTDARTFDVPAAAATFAFYAETIDKLAGELAPAGAGAHAYVARVPLGVVGAITAWNFPLETAAWKLAPALAAGNAVILKPSERAPLSSLRLAELAAEAGVPEGVLNVVPGLGPVAGRALARHPDVDALAFTGSTAVGKQLLVDSGQSNLKKVSLECGGKSPNLVFADVDDLDAAAAAACRGIFTNQGEVCSANSRLLVQHEIADELLAALLRHAGEIRLGHPFDPEAGMGPLVDSTHADRVTGYLADLPASAVLAGGRRRAVEGSDCYVEPTVVAVDDPGSRLLREEIFGPVLAVQLFDTEHDAVTLANETSYGLAASVWTGNLNRALRVADQLVAGTVSVNTVDALSLGTPFGGFKQSGHGRDLSVHALDNYTGLKTTWISYT